MAVRWTAPIMDSISKGARYTEGFASFGRVFFEREDGGRMTLHMRVHDKEPIGMALRRFKKLIERSGVQKELRAHQHYEKPSELRRRARLHKEKAARKARGLPPM